MRTQRRVWVRSPLAHDVFHSGSIEQARELPLPACFALLSRICELPLARVLELVDAQAVLAEHTNWRAFDTNLRFHPQASSSSLHGAGQGVSALFSAGGCSFSLALASNVMVEHCFELRDARGCVEAPKRGRPRRALPLTFGSDQTVSHRSKITICLLPAARQAYHSVSDSVWLPALRHASTVFVAFLRGGAQSDFVRLASRFEVAAQHVRNPSRDAALCYQLSASVRLCTIAMFFVQLQTYHRIIFVKILFEAQIRDCHSPRARCSRRSCWCRKRP